MCVAQNFPGHAKVPHVYHASCGYHRQNQRFLISSCPCVHPEFRVCCRTFLLQGRSSPPPPRLLLLQNLDELTRSIGRVGQVEARELLPVLGGRVVVVVVEVGHLACRAARGNREVLVAVRVVLAVADEEATVLEEEGVEDQAAGAAVAVREGATGSRAPCRAARARSACSPATMSRMRRGTWEGAGKAVKPAHTGVLR